MKAIQVEGSSDELILSTADVLVPELSEGQVLIRVHAAGVITTELRWYPTTHRETGAPRLHAVPGHEFSGTLACVGEGVTGFMPGQEIFGMNDWFAEGAMAEYCLTVPSSIADKPKSLSHTEAATVPISALTAWQGLFDRAAIQPGERILVQGGAGAGGLFVVQLAHHHGAYVIATASSPNVTLIQELGADEVIDYKLSTFEDGLAPVDVVFDTVGGSIRDRSARVIKPRGRMISIAADGETTTDPKARAAYFIVEPNRTQLTDIAQMIDTGHLKTFVKAIVTLEDAGLAYTGAVSGKRSFGKFVVNITTT